MAGGIEPQIQNPDETFEPLRGPPRLTWLATREEPPGKASYLVSAALIAASAMPAAAGEISDGKVKIGILNDQSGV
ncbi:MAG: hypothetical protein E5V75_34825 [Mesorhizobium sp.]|nr:MAG: hypothetical protein E5V75_34825 [Mesorhizobium sp.]